MDIDILKFKYCISSGRVFETICSDCRHLFIIIIEGDQKFLYAGTYMGDVKMFNLQTSEETTFQCHESPVYHIQPSRDSRLLITCSSWRTPYSKLWGNIDTYFDEKQQFKDEEYLEFSHLVEDKLVGTKAEGVATIYDLRTSQLTRTLKPTSSNAYSRNRLD